ncbi:urease subunit beta [Acidithiobacillus sp. M4-SHS-6]|uniref:urease subunit beta n=1 Tax=Acidithiobacillus sp. M4-SHS-6 TaxID=3383024 RepID=UPI0039BE0411
MIPGEIRTLPGTLMLNADCLRTTLLVTNTGDRPIQVGSHYHFYEANSALQFMRAKAFGKRLDIPAGTAMRFEPGDDREVVLIPFAGERRIYGFNAQVEGPLDGGS